MSEDDDFRDEPPDANGSDAQPPEEVGYKKPPKDSQFKKGESGNPKGRPKGARNIQSIVMNEARKRIKVNVGGKVVFMTKAEAAVQQMFNAAASGNLKAIRDIHYWMEAYAEVPHAADEPASNEADRATQENIIKRFRRNMEQAKTEEVKDESPGGKSNDADE